MRRRMFALRDVFWVETARDQRVVQVDGRALCQSGALLFRDAAGREVYRIQEKLLRVRDSMYVYRGGDVAAKVHNGLFLPLRDRFLIDVPGHGDLTTRGNVVYLEYGLERNGVTIARVSKRWFGGHDAYGVDVAPEEDRLLVLAITVIIDSMCHTML